MKTILKYITVLIIKYLQKRYKSSNISTNLWKIIEFYKLFNYLFI